MARSGTSWTQEQKINGPAYDGDFGRASSMSGDGDLVVITARQADANGLNFSGAAYVYH